MLNNMRVQSLIFPINSITEHTYNFFFSIHMTATLWDTKLKMELQLEGKGIKRLLGGHFSVGTARPTSSTKSPLFTNRKWWRPRPLWRGPAQPKSQAQHLDFWAFCSSFPVFSQLLHPAIRCSPLDQPSLTEKVKLIQSHFQVQF